MKIRLRGPKPGDIGWVISMHGAIYAEEFQFNASFELDIARKILLLHEKQEALRKLWIAEVNTSRAGSIAVSSLTPETAFINFLLVLPSFRGLSIARMLMNQAIEYSRASNMKKLRLETYSNLKNARRLYRNIGLDVVRTDTNVEKYGHRFDREYWEIKL